jgi:hypothetical protein
MKNKINEKSSCIIIVCTAAGMAQRARLQAWRSVHAGLASCLPQDPCIHSKSLSMPLVCWTCQVTCCA